MLNTKKSLSLLSPYLHLSLFIIFLFVFALSTSPVHAFDASNAGDFAKQANTEGVGATETDINVMAANIAKAAFSIGGIIFFLLIFYGGYTWLMARGEEEQVQKAQNIIIGAIIGLFIMVGSYAITNFVLSRMFGGGQSSPATSAGAGEPKGPIGCCLNEVEAKGGSLDWGNTHWWNSEITDQETCVTNIKTCTKDDQLCESKNGAWYDNITDADACWDLAKSKPTN